MSPLDLWDGQPVAQLRTEWGLPSLVAFAACASTNDEARRLAERGAAHGSTVVADHQSAGRGRHGRGWVDRPAASLLLSMVLRPAGGGDAAALPLRVGLAAARALRAQTGVPVDIEWPNDLVVADRKLGGILCEAAHAGGRLDFVIAGLGINVAALPDDLDAATRARATSLAEAVAPATVTRAHVAGAIARALAALSADGPMRTDELEQLRALDSLNGRPVRLGTGREGVARGILPDGALVVDTDAGTISVRSGSVAPAAPRFS